MIFRHNRTWHVCITSFTIPHNVIFAWWWTSESEGQGESHTFASIQRRQWFTFNFCASNTRLDWIAGVKYKEITSFDLGFLLSVFFQKYCNFQPLVFLPHISAAWPQLCDITGTALLRRLWLAKAWIYLANLVPQGNGTCGATGASLHWTRTRQY